METIITKILTSQGQRSQSQVESTAYDSAVATPWVN
jgi:hypothetical protein